MPARRVFRIARVAIVTVLFTHAYGADRKAPRRIDISVTKDGFNPRRIQPLAVEAKVPTTAAEHEAMAKRYRDEATQFKKVADDHKAMAAAYAAAHQPTNGPTANTGAVKMQKHCETLAKDADKLASDAERPPTFTNCAPRHCKGSRRLRGQPDRRWG